MESAVTVVCSREYVQMPHSERIAEIVKRVRQMEDLRRSKGEMSTIIATGVALRREMDERLARMFLESHRINASTIDRVLSGCHRKSDI